jgi:hypothetical protein
LRDAFGDWGNCARPRRRRLSQALGELVHQATIPCARLEEPITLEWLVGKPVQHVGINKRSNWLHQVAGEIVASDRIRVQHAKAGVEAERGGG